MHLRVKKSTVLIFLIIFTIFNLSAVGIIFTSQKLEKGIEITKDGFAPSSITAEAGSSITFVNTDSAAHWPASNVHPTHDLYPEFDPTQQIEPQKEWTFIPTKEGRWKFHDHLFPHKRGELIVTKPSLLTKILLALPFNRQEQTSVTASTNPIKQPIQNTEAYNEIKSIADNQGVEKAWEFVQTTYGNQDGSFGEAHDFAHFVGGLIFGSKGFPGLKICTTEFAFGCYHGFLDTAFKKDLSKLAEAEKACGTVGDIGTGPYASCIHGIGHGVASFYNTSDLQKSLANCEKLINGQTYCFDGVFMEFERAGESFYKANDPLYPCNSLDAKYVYSCGRNQPTAMMQYLDMDFSEVARECAKANNEDLKISCFVALGFQAAYSSQGETEGILKLCKTLNDPTFRLQCTSAAAGELIFQNIPGWQQKAFTICQSLEENNQTECTRHIEQIIKDYNRT